VLAWRISTPVEYFLHILLHSLRVICRQGCKVIDKERSLKALLTVY
jgi:hypothetical protein